MLFQNTFNAFVCRWIEIVFDIRQKGGKKHHYFCSASLFLLSLQCISKPYIQMKMEKKYPLYSIIKGIFSLS
jgi:hypothetical protein